MKADLPPTRQEAGRQLPLPRSGFDAILDVFGERDEIAALVREIVLSLVSNAFKLTLDRRDAA